MTVRILISDEPGARLVRLAGRLSAAEVDELEHVIADAPGATCLDLAELRSADAAGLALLRSLRARGIAMQGVRPDLAWRIEANSNG